MPLSPRNLANIQAISSTDVVKTVAGLERFLSQERWVGPRNRYATETRETIKAETNPGPLVAPKQLSEYIAASIVLHASDGWSFFGAAVSSLLHGDPHRSRHLAYYAELRAAMSMLAGFGIGVFADRHFVIDGPSSAAPLPAKSGTHTFVWDCVEHFGSQNDLGELFGSIIQPYGRPLREWLLPVGGTGVIAPQSREWFLQWNQDLQMPQRDHDARNESSYRPDGIPSPWNPNAPTVLEFVGNLWSGLEPEPTSPFEQIDRNILRLAVERSYLAQYGARRPARRPAYADFVQQVVTYQAFGPAARDFWTDFLLRRTSPQDHDTLVASRVSPRVRDGSEYAILARAALLLRAASGGAIKLLSSAGVARTSMEFWRDSLGIGRGLWQTPGGNPMDLWADVKPLIDDIRDFQVRWAAGDQTFFRISTELSHAVAGLACGERIAIWSMTN